MHVREPRVAHEVGNFANVNIEHSNVERVENDGTIMRTYFPHQT